MYRNTLWKWREAVDLVYVVHVANDITDKKLVIKLVIVSYWNAVNATSLWSDKIDTLSITTMVQKDLLYASRTFNKNLIAIESELLMMFDRQKINLFYPIIQNIIS